MSRDGGGVTKSVPLKTKEETKEKSKEESVRRGGSGLDIDKLDLLDQQRWISAILKSKFEQFAVTKDLIKDLCERNVISTFNEENLNNICDKKKPERLYQILERKGWENFKVARNILNSHITELSHLWDEKLVEEIPILQVKYQPPAQEETSNTPSEVPSSLPSYDNPSKRKKGICLVLHNIQFTDPKYSTRDGAVWDKMSLEKVFRHKLGFSFEYHENKSKAYILELLDQFVKYDKLKEYKCCVVIVMSHGQSESFVCSDGNKIRFDDLFRRFNGDKCTGLASVPKWFIIQACRAVKNQPESEGFNKAVNLHDGEEASVCERVDKKISIPACADFFLSYSTAPGYYSYRDPTSGSWFIQTLSRIVEKYCSREDVANMMTRVNKVVAHEYVHTEHVHRTRYEGSKDVEVRQMPSHVHMLTGAFFLCREARFRHSHDIPISSSLV